MYFDYSFVLKLIHTVADDAERSTAPDAGTAVDDDLQVGGRRALGFSDSSRLSLSGSEDEVEHMRPTGRDAVVRPGQKLKVFYCPLHSLC